MSTLDDLPVTFRARLESMYSGEPQQGTDGPVEIDKNTRITPPEGMWIYDTCQRLKPAHAVEVGLGYGFSTVFVLAALHNIGTGDHTAIDPYQRSLWHGVGALQAAQFGMEHSFNWVEESSFRALGRFAAENRQFELVYIDGNHRFDDVLVDFTLSAEICPVGGEIILDDMWLPSIETVASWIRSNRPDFHEIRTPVSNIAHFERTGKDERHWMHFVPFHVSRETLAKRLSGPLAKPVKRILGRQRK